MYHLRRPRSLNKRKAWQGFSLIEMAITLVVIGTLAGLTLPFLSKVQDKKRYSLSKKNIEKVFYALAHYGFDHKCLPYASTSFDEGISIENIYMGYVPYRTLGLDRSAALDGWGQPLKYVRASNNNNTVNESLEKLSGTQRFFNGIFTSLDVKDAKGQPVVKDVLETKIVVVVIAFNDDMKGSPLGPWEKINRDNRKITKEDNPTFIKAPYSIHPTYPFRQTVEWLTGDQLMLNYALALRLLPKPEKNTESPPLPCEKPSEAAPPSQSFQEEKDLPDGEDDLSDY